MGWHSGGSSELVDGWGVFCFVLLIKLFIVVVYVGGDVRVRGCLPYEARWGIPQSILFLSVARTRLSI